MTDAQYDFATALAAGKVLIADGATGTNLQAAGLPVGSPPEDWVLRYPERIRDLHRAFVDAGSDIILSCSFGANRLCRSATSATHSAGVNRDAAAIARAVAREAARAVFVAGSMGPTGEMMAPLGTLSHADVVAAYADQSAALVEGGVDLLLLETFYSLDEAKAAIEGVRKSSALPLICSFSYDRGQRTMMGVTPTQMVQSIGPLGVSAIGANCGTGLDEMELVLAELVAAKTSLPIWVKPNAGLPHGSPPQYDVSPDDMATAALHFVEGGAQIVGGCCGSSPEHVGAIRRAVDSRDGKRPTKHERH